jgi:hypothetical protein
LLRRIGPLLHAVARKPEMSTDAEKRQHGASRNGARE